MDEDLHPKRNYSMLRPRHLEKCSSSDKGLQESETLLNIVRDTLPTSFCTGDDAS